MTKIILRIALFAAMITVGLLAFAGVQKVQACGGFFCQNVPINQNAERIIFLMNEKEQKVSAIVGINYVGEAKDFSWVVALVRWLRENGFRVTKEMEPYIDIYAKEKQYFVAFKLRRGVEVTAIEPVKLTYHSTYASIPLRLTAIAATEDMPVLVWIFGATQYIPQNYAHPKVDFNSWVAPGRLANPYPDRIFDNAYGTYGNILKGFQTQYKGKAFVTEMARSTADVLRFNKLIRYSDKNLIELLETYPYVTRLRAQLSPHEMTKDPVFVAQPGLPDVSESINLDGNPQIDPLLYWGCSSRTVITDTVRTKLPPARTHVDNLKLDVAHPVNWKLSTFSILREQKQDFWALSSKTVTLETIKDFMAGRATAPMLIATPLTLNYNHPLYDFFPEPDVFSNMLLQSLDIEPTPDNIAKLAVNRHKTMLYRYNIGTTYEGVLIALLAQPGYWTANPTMYDAILKYASSYQYYARPDWQHTLLVNGHNPYWEKIAGIPFPTGWIEKTVDGDAAITLETPPKGAENIMFRITPLNLSSLRVFQRDEEQKKTAQERVDKLYGVIAKKDEAIIWCGKDLSGYAKYSFAQNGNTGYVLISDEAVVGAYAPTADYEQHKETLNTMLDAYIQGIVCGEPQR